MSNIVNSSSPSCSINIPVHEETPVNKYKDSLAEWIHQQDPQLSLETVNALPAEQIMIWRFGCPRGAQFLFHKWLEDGVASLYGDDEPAQKTMEETLNTIYQKIKDPRLSSSHTPSLNMIDHLARNILKEYSHMIEKQATEESVLKIFFAKELNIPPDSHLMAVTIKDTKVHIQKVVRDWLGYLHSDYPRQSLAKVLMLDYPEQVLQIPYLTLLWSKHRMKMAPIWEQ